MKEWKSGWRSLTIAMLGLPIGAAAHAAEICPANLGAAVNAVVDRPAFQRARWGILVQTLAPDAQTLYAQDADRFFVPASNAKLLTTAAALEHLGAQFRVHTSVYQQADTGTVLEVVGQGDPGFTDRQLHDLAKQIGDHQIKQIDRLIGNDSYFQGEHVNESWEWEDIQAGYGAPVNSLILNQNLLNLTLYPQQLGQPLRVQWEEPAPQWQTVNRSSTVAPSAPEFVSVGRDLSQPVLQVRGQLRAGSAAEPVAIAITQPAQHFIDRLQQSLAEQQIQVRQTEITTDPSPLGREIARVESAPLGDLIVITNHESNNLYAEAILRWLGVTPTPTAAPDNTTLKSGLTTLKRTLTALGVDPDSYRLVDGSGLSRQNLVSPGAIVQTLQTMARSKDAAIYRSSLSVAGRSGTLQDRFQGSLVQGRLQGKTGAMSGVAALSGYLQPPDYAPLIFSVIVNQSDRPLGDIQQAIDAIIEQLVQLRSC